jgi:hypothetical protein
MDKDSLRYWNTTGSCDRGSAKASELYLGWRVRSE